MACHTFWQSTPWTKFITCYPANMQRAFEEMQWLTWRALLRGLTGPFAACAPNHGVQRHTKFPLLPAWTILPSRASSICHLSGIICHIVNHPLSADFMGTLKIFVAVSYCETIIFTLPIIYEFCTELCSFVAPVAAMYCWTMYCAEDASCYKDSDGAFSTFNKKCMNVFMCVCMQAYTHT